MGSSRTRARTRVPCIGWRILNHCTTQEVQTSFSFLDLSSGSLRLSLSCDHVLCTTFHFSRCSTTLMGPLQLACTVCQALDWMIHRQLFIFILTSLDEADTIIFPHGHPLLPLTQLFTRFIVQGYKVPVFLQQNPTLHNIPWWTRIHIIYLFISWWIFGLVPLFGYYKKCYWTFMYKPLWGHTFSLLFNIYSGAELLGHMEILFNFLRNCQTVFQRGYSILCFH